jgi:hypothetical protein
MSPLKLSVAGLALAAGFGLSGCASDGYGYGGGYGGVSLGYNGGDWDPYYGGYSGSPYWGWNNDYYYPGTGYYVYDRQNRRHRWNDSQRGYWQGRTQSWQRDRRDIRPVWRDYGVNRGGMRGGGENRGGGGRRR